jgi:predicted site-specific integrase-resolvase
MIKDFNNIAIALDYQETQDILNLSEETLKSLIDTGYLKCIVDNQGLENITIESINEFLGNNSELFSKRVAFSYSDPFSGDGTGEGEL